MEDLAPRFQEILGFLELGMWEEANECVEHLPPQLKTHPSVLEWRLQIYQALDAVELMKVVAEHLVQIQPEKPEHWLSCAYAARHLEGLEPALIVLEKALQLHPRHAGILYDLALHEVWAGSLETAQAHLEEAIVLDPSLRSKALGDPELGPMIEF